MVAKNRSKITLSEGEKDQIQHIYYARSNMNPDFGIGFVKLEVWS